MEGNFMKQINKLALLAVAGVFLFLAAPAHAQIWFDGNIYMKMLWGTDRLGTALYNFTAIPGEGLGDSGQGTQFEFYINGKVGKKVQFKISTQSRFYKNFWTNAGGYGAPQACFNGQVFDPNNPNCLGSEVDPRSNQVIKMRNASMIISPGYKWLDRVWVGENDLGGFDPFVIGKIRYIDRFNISAVQATGNASHRKFQWDFIRISNSTFLQPANNGGFNGGQFQPSDGTYGFQAKVKVSPEFDVYGLISHANDIEIDPSDFFTDNGRDIKSKFKNTVGGVVAGIHPSPKFDFKGSFYYSDSKTDLNLNGTNDNFGFAISGFDAAPHGNRSDPSIKLNASVNDPWDNGFSVQAEYFNIGKDYVSMWAARRETDVLLTEGFDAAFKLPGPQNIAFGVFGGGGDAPQPGTPTRVNIGYGGWSGPTVQVPTITADNQFTDFDEPIAETVIGWKGFTAKPLYAKGNWDVAGEITWIDYNTNWQMWDDPTLTITNSPYPAQEADTGVGHNYRSAYAPFSDRSSFIGVASAKYSFLSGLQIWGKYKHVGETDNRMTDPRFLPFVNGQKNIYGHDAAGNALSTGDFYSNPPVITVTYLDGSTATGNQWKPFDSLADDDRDLKYNVIAFGVGKQLHQDFYASVQYEYYNADLFDGTTAFQAYNLHEMAGGKHHKNKLIGVGRFTIAGLPEAGFQIEHNWGSFDPDFGGGFVPQQIQTTDQEKNFHQPIGTLGFFNRFGGFNSIQKRTFSQSRLKVYLKILF
jgi:hypothetical protein